MPTAIEMFAQIMDLGMAVMARSDGILSARIYDLFGLYPAIFTAGIGKSRLQETAAAAATVIVRFVGRHVDEIFLADNLFHNVTEVIGHGVAKGLPDQLTGVLDGEGYFQVFIPIGIHRQSSFPDPFGIILNDAGYLKFVRNIEFFQSGPDCEEFVSSLRVEPYLAAQVVNSLCLDPDNMFPALVIGKKQAVIFRRPPLGTIGPVGFHLV